MKVMEALSALLFRITIKGKDKRFLQAHPPSWSAEISMYKDIKEKAMKVTMYTDGAARGNPNGPGGYGTILQYVDSKGQVHMREYSAGYEKTTNNRMEMMAVIAGLEALNRPCEVDVYSDSQYVVNAFNQHWIEGWKKRGWKRSGNKPVLNMDLWQRMLKAMEPHQVRFHWVKGHAGHPENERCDFLATSAADGTDLLLGENLK